MIIAAASCRVDFITGFGRFLEKIAGNGERKMRGWPDDTLAVTK
jgi:hypothetical protein